MPSRFDRDTAVDPLGGGRYRVRIDPGWRIVNGPNGGYVAASAARPAHAAARPRWTPAPRQGGRHGQESLT